MTPWLLTRFCPRYPKDVGPAVSRTRADVETLGARAVVPVIKPACEAAAGSKPGSIPDVLT